MQPTIFCRAARHPHRKVPTIYKRQTRAPSTASGPPPSQREAFLKPTYGETYAFPCQGRWHGIAVTDE